MTGMFTKNLIGDSTQCCTVPKAFGDFFQYAIYDDRGNGFAGLSVAFSVAIDNRFTTGGPFDDLRGLVILRTADPSLFCNAKLDNHAKNYIKNNFGLMFIVIQKYREG